MQIIQKILTFLNKIYSWRKPKLAKENIKKKKQKKGRIATNLENKNTSWFIASYNIPLLETMQKMISMSICNKRDPVRQVNFLQKEQTR